MQKPKKEPNLDEIYQMAKHDLGFKDMIDPDDFS